MKFSRHKSSLNWNVLLDAVIFFPHSFEVFMYKTIADLGKVKRQGNAVFLVLFLLSPAMLYSQNPILSPTHLFSPNVTMFPGN